MSRASGQLVNTNQSTHTMPSGRLRGEPVQARARTLPPPPPLAAGVKVRNASPSVPAPSLAVGLPIDPIFFETPQARKASPAWLQGVKYGLGAGLFVALGYGVALLQAPAQPQVHPVLEHSTQPATAKLTPALQPTAADMLPKAAPPVVPAAVVNAPVSPSPLAAAASDAQIQSEDQPKTARNTVSARRAARKWRAKARPSKGATRLAATNDVSRITDQDAATHTAKPAQRALPARPSRDAVKAAMATMKPALTACVGDAHGFSQATLTITGEGRVIYSRIDGAFVGTPEGSCMARTLRKATFPAFAGESFRIRYPLMF